MTWIDHAGDRRWRNRDLVRERDRHRTRGWWSWILGLVLAVLPAALYLVEQGRCTQLAYRSDALRTELEELVETERRLRVERARLETLSAIEEWAQKRHGMLRPEAEQVVIVSFSPPSGAR